MTEGRRDRDGVRAGGRRSRIEHVAARALLEATSIDEAASGILQAICETLGWSHGALWVVDRASDRLRLAHVYNPPSVQLPGVRAHQPRADVCTWCRAAGPGVGFREPVWIPDVTLSELPARPHRGARAPARGVRISDYGARRRDQRDGVFQRGDPGAGRALLDLHRGRPPDWQFFERRRAQEELDVLHMSLDMLCLAGSDGYFKRLNPAWRRRFGFSRDELLSRPYLEFIHPEDPRRHTRPQPDVRARTSSPSRTDTSARTAPTVDVWRRPSPRRAAGLRDRA